MSFVQSQSLSKLICKNCRKYLSHFPIYHHPARGSLCGRCLLPLGEDVTRNEIYEHLAESLKFPCCYASEGCLENLVPEKIPQHEKYCIFRRLDCPLGFYGGCEWQGFEKDLLDHFEQRHPTFILKDTRFELDFVNSHKESYLFPYGEDLFIVNRTNDSKTNIFTISMSNIGGNATAENYIYKIILEDGTRTHTHVLTSKITEQTDINGEVIRGILQDPYSVIAHIEIMEDNNKRQDDEEEEEFNEAVNYDLLRELECFVCMEYMVPPIHQCITGHSICAKCKSQVTECPNCRNEFKDTQNFALAQIITYLTYPCKHPKCKFTANPYDIKKHELTCIHGPFKCPLAEFEGCTTEVTFKEIGEHLQISHYENLLEMEIVNLPFDVDEYTEDEDCFILKYGLRMFKLQYLYKDHRFHWAMQLIGPSEESSKYKFEIDVIDNSGNNNRAYFRSLCSPLSKKADAFGENKSYIYLDFAQIRSMITSEFSYRARILKE